MRIAVIDDSDDGLNLMRDQATSLGHQVSFLARDRAEAIKALSTHEVDVIISDHVMPGADGARLMREIRNTKPGIRVVAIAGGYLEKSMLPTSRLDGACSVLNRPYQLSELADAIAGDSRP